MDFGSRRIGVAISDPAGIMAQPLTVIERRNKDADMVAISKLIEEYKVDEIVIGLPVSMTGELGPQAKVVLEYADSLKEMIKVPIRTWDERLTTALAERTLLESEVKRGQRKEIIDKIAAATMLQSYLDSKRPGEHQL